MELLVERREFTNKSTIGQLFVDGWFECLTLEDVFRTGPKVQDATAIPDGRYQVIIDMSTRFKKQMMHILNVPNFSGIRIHSGNTSEDTSGCILVGSVRGIDTVLESRQALIALQSKVAIALDSKEDVWVTVQHAK